MTLEKTIEKLRLLANGVPVSNIKYGYYQSEIKDMYLSAAEALEKQIPKKVFCEVVDENGVNYEFEHYICPGCKNVLHQHYKKSREPMRYKQNFCVDCGQKLDWEDR